jgi:hypothetical protein
MKRAQAQIELLVLTNVAADMYSMRAVVHLLYTTQRLCGGTLELSPSDDHDDETLDSIIAKGVARLELSASRFRISDPIFAEALLHLYNSRPMTYQNGVIMKVLAMNGNFHRALVSQDSAAKGFLLERVLAWLALSGQLRVFVYDPPAAVDAAVESWTVKAEADTAGTIREFNLGNTSAHEPVVLR